jgi:hypothetical protein
VSSGYLPVVAKHESLDSRCESLNTNQPRTLDPMCVKGATLHCAIISFFQIGSVLFSTSCSHYNMYSDLLHMLFFLFTFSTYGVKLNIS